MKFVASIIKKVKLSYCFLVKIVASISENDSGSNPRPGEISLAHNGTLFLDELPEFDRKVLEVLREPLETGHITISRAARQVDFPARFQLIAAMNPCPCGFLGDASGRCHCKLQNYLIITKISDNLQKYLIIVFLLNILNRSYLIMDLYSLSQRRLYG
jgi:predicted ATPase with chaperone activity